MTRGRGQEYEQQHDGHEHPEATPEHMRDMQALAPELRVTARLEVDADDEQRGDGRDQE